MRAAGPRAGRQTECAQGRSTMRGGGGDGDEGGAKRMTRRTQTFRGLHMKTISWEDTDGQTREIGVVYYTGQFMGFETVLQKWNYKQIFIALPAFIVKSQSDVMNVAAQEVLQVVYLVKIENSQSDSVQARYDIDEQIALNVGITHTQL